MYSVYLVDDEPLALSHMKKSFPWQEHAFEVVGACGDPLAAMREILSLSPDVVFTDIHMAKMDGLTLIERLKESGCTALFVVISAYDRFEYARRLIRMEGFDYMLKPVEATQCAALLDSLGARLQKERGHRERPATTSAELNRILAHLQSDYRHKQSLHAIAQQFSINPNYICRLFSKHLQTTFSSYLTKLRMEHAANMLQSSEMPVKEIALCSGYEDYFYFCRVFRDTFGCTPSQYRSNG